MWVGISFNILDMADNICLWALVCNQVLIMPARTQRNCAKGLRQVNFSLYFGRLGGKQELKPAARWAHYCGVFLFL